jgi:hypothetical protein
MEALYMEDMSVLQNGHWARGRQAGVSARAAPRTGVPVNDLRRRNCYPTGSTGEEGAAPA